MGKVKLTINLERPDAVYYAGETIKGEVIVETEEEIKAKEIRLELSGHARVLWSETHGKVTIVYHNSEDYLSNNVVLRKDDAESFVLQPGQHQYLFETALPLQLPSSFEYTHARVRYFMKLVVDRPWHIDDKLTRAFTVLSHLDLNQTPNVMIPVAAENSKFLCCCCCRTGPISASLKLDRSGLVPGERIPVHAVCVNHSNRVMKATRMILWQGITCRTLLKTRRFTQKLVTVQRPQIHAGGTDTWHHEAFTVPPCAPTGLPGCSIIDTDYYILLEMDPAGPSLDLEVAIPVVIGTIPPLQVLNNYNLGIALGSPYHADYPSLPPPTYEAFKNPDMAYDHAPEDEGGRFIPAYPIYNWYSSSAPTATK